MATQHTVLIHLEEESLYVKFNFSLVKYPDYTFPDREIELLEVINDAGIDIIDDLPKTDLEEIKRQLYEC